MSLICSTAIEAGKLYNQVPVFSFYPSKFHLVSKKFTQNNVFDIEYSSSSGVVMCLQTQSLETNSNLSIPTIQHSPTISYFINKCGLPLDSAISASAKIYLETTDRPDSVLQLFKDYDFTETQMKKLFTKSPHVILLDPVGTIKPIFEIMEFLGLSKPEIADFVSTNSFILERSFEYQIAPICSLLKTYLTKKKHILIALQRWTFLTGLNYERCQENIRVLRDHGVPDVNISQLILLEPKAVQQNPDRFKDMVNEVVRMKFDPNRRNFVHAIASMGAMRKSFWEKKLQAYKSFGMSEEEFIAAFRRQPNIVLSSEKKIYKLMDFFTNVLKFTAFHIIKYPNLMLISYEKNLIPRCSVLSYLLSKCVIKNKLKLPRALSLTKDQFEKEYVDNYMDVAPEVLKVYQGELGYPKFKTLREYR